MLSRMKVAALIALLITLSACGLGSSDEASSGEEAAGLANEMENVETPEGQDAVCIFPDGSQCGQWDFLSGRCGQEFTYCVQQGFTLEEGANIGTCMFPDGSSCMEITYFEGDCAAGE